MADDHEARRLRALADYGVLDTAPEEAFDRLTSLAADLFNAPIALVSLIDSERQWFKSRYGLAAASTPRSQAFCAHAIALDPHATLVVEDATRDARFVDNPLVTGDPSIRFYAGAVLTGSDGFNFGTLCVIDTVARPTPSDTDLRRLQILAQIVVDELELRRATRQAADQRRLLDLAERLSGVGHWRYLVEDGRVIYSEEIYRIHGQPTPSEANGEPLDFDRTVGLYSADDQPVIRERMAKALRTGEGYGFETRFRRPDGEWCDVVCRAECLTDDRGVVFGLYGVLQDVTAERGAMRELQRAREAAEELTRQAEFAESVADLGHWRLDARTREIGWSSNTYRIYGLPEGSRLELPALVAMTHPEDAARSMTRLQRQLSDGDAEEPSITRITRPDGQMRYLAGNSRVERAADGEIVAVIGTLVDVTEQKTAELALAESERRFRNLTVNAPDMISESGLDGTITYVSPASLAITGFTPEELLGRNSFDLMHPDDAVRMREMCDTVFAAKGALAAWPVEYRMRHAAGQEIWLESKPTLLSDPETGRFTGLTDVVRDITPRKRLEAELRLAQAEAEAAAVVKGEFLANMSHELRTPLTSIIGFTGLAGEQSDLTDLTRTYVRRVGEASRALLCTVNDILDFSKLEAGQVSIQPQPVSWTRLSRGALDLFTPQAGAKDLTLILDDDVGELVVALDPDRIRQILLNLVSNAVKFTAEGAVTLTTRYDPGPGRLRVEVQDTGLGVSPEKQERLFKRFSQVDGSLTRTQGGTGLGLAICKGLVEAMGGSIGVESEAGVGSRFWFEIPAPLARLAETGDEGPDVAQPTFGGVRVLVVDDHPANRELARLFLAGVGAEVTEAYDGEMAAEMAAEMPYDVILMDLRMPKLDGPGSLRRIRGTSGPNDATPILAFTADADSDTADRLEAMGFDDVVAKPLEPATLIAAVARATALVLEPARVSAVR